MILMLVIWNYWISLVWQLRWWYCNVMRQCYNKWLDPFLTQYMSEHCFCCSTLQCAGQRLTKINLSQFWRSLSEPQVTLKPDMKSQIYWSRRGIFTVWRKSYRALSQKEGLCRQKAGRCSLNSKLNWEKQPVWTTDMQRISAWSPGLDAWTAVDSVAQYQSISWRRHRVPWLAKVGVRVRSLPLPRKLDLHFEETRVSCVCVRCV